MLFIALLFHLVLSPAATHPVLIKSQSTPNFFDGQLGLSKASPASLAVPRRPGPIHALTSGSGAEPLISITDSWATKGMRKVQSAPADLCNIASIVPVDLQANAEPVLEGQMRWKPFSKEPISTLFNIYGDLSEFESQSESHHTMVEENPAINKTLFSFPVIVPGIANVLGRIDIDTLAESIKVVIKGSLELEKQLFRSLATGQCVIGTEESCIVHWSGCPLEELTEKIYTAMHAQIWDFFLNQVLIFGHSIGGGLAQLLALRMYYEPLYDFVKSGGANNALNQFKVMAFAAPKVFNNDWKEYPLKDVNLINVFHALDPVPLFPEDFKLFGKVIEVGDRGLGKTLESSFGFVREKCKKICWKNIASNFENWWTFFHFVGTLNDFMN